jgi:glycosyltransferase involved in cell wall biosynthesis
MVVLEAMARAVPVIATRVGGIPEVIEDNYSGYLIAPDDIGALGERLLAVAADPAGRRNIGLAGRTVVQRRFSLERYFARIAELYNECGSSKAKAE